mmetsp:Transcript_86125/g.165776  ORF Transcript_86125/g.165776 Transcript_86125/m.165776 type:complete len:152 (-) Transcript_86125:363-818(-)
MSRTLKRQWSAFSQSTLGIHLLQIQTTATGRRKQRPPAKAETASSNKAIATLRSHGCPSENMCSGEKFCSGEVPDEALYIQCAIYIRYSVVVEQAQTNCRRVMGPGRPCPSQTEVLPLLAPPSHWSKRSADDLEPASIRNGPVPVALTSLI